MQLELPALCHAACVHKKTCPCSPPSSPNLETAVIVASAKATRGHNTVARVSASWHIALVLWKVYFLKAAGKCFKAANISTKSPAQTTLVLSEYCVQLWSLWHRKDMDLYGAGPLEGHKNGQRPGAPLPLGKSKRVGAVQPGEDKASGRPCSLSILKGGL